jgi:ATP-binding cassette subfamily B multidrug efflux pump
MSQVTSRIDRFLEESSYLREYLWKYRKWVSLGLLALVTVDVLEVLPPLILKWVVDAAMENSGVLTLVKLAAAYFAVGIVQALCRYGWRMYLIRTSWFAGADLRSRFAHHLFKLSLSFYDKRRVGDLMSLATNDVEAVRQCLGQGLLAFADAMFSILTIPVAMYLLSPELTLLALIPLPIIPWIYLHFEKRLHDRFEKVQESYGRISALTQEALTGVRVTKAFAKEHAQVERMRRAGDQFIRENLSYARIDSVFGYAIDFITSTALVILLYVGGRQLIEGSEALTIGTFVAFQRYIHMMAWPMSAVGRSVSRYQRAVTSSERLKEIFAIASDVPQAPKPRVPTPRGAIELRNLSFRFPGVERDVLRNVSLTVHPGERIALVGAIGCGKSALLSLIPRLYPVPRGMLLVDGVDVNDWDIQELRAQVGYISQDVFLFSESVLENIAYGLAAQIPSVSAIENATQMASVHDDVLGLVGSYETRLGERGVNLSGGQKQRLTIARALVKQPSILVMDDALSSVDVQTEERILRGLRARSNRNTEVIAAHRISTIKDADRIVVLKDGEISQQGTHQDLIRDKAGIYFHFYEQQQLKAELENYAESIQ